MKNRKPGESAQHTKRMTFVCDDLLYRQLEDFAFLERRTISSVVRNALEDYCKARREMALPEEQTPTATDLDLELDVLVRDIEATSNAIDDLSKRLDALDAKEQQ